LKRRADKLVCTFWQTADQNQGHHLIYRINLELGCLSSTGMFRIDVLVWQQVTQHSSRIRSVCLYTAAVGPCFDYFEFEAEDGKVECTDYGVHRTLALDVAALAKSQSPQIR
jgi:hypothetical protein